MIRRYTLGFVFGWVVALGLLSMLATVATADETLPPSPTNIELVGNSGTLHIDGRDTPPLRSGKPNEIIWSFPVRYGGAREISVGLQFMSLGDGEWSVEVSDLNGRVADVISSNVARGIGTGSEIWSNPILGHAGWVRIKGDGAGLKVKITALFHAATPFIPKTRVGKTLDWVAFPMIEDKDSVLFNHGKSIALLRLIREDKTARGQKYRKAICTAFVVTPKLIMTNAHCVSDKVRGITAHFDYDRPGLDMNNSFKVKSRPTLSSPKSKLDYALFEVATGEGRSLPASLVLARNDAPAGKPFQTVLHPGDVPKVAVVKNCERIVQVALPLKDTSIWHTCDSYKGGSGHPIFLNGKVIALHNKGFLRPPNYNRAVPMRKIVEDLEGRAMTDPTIKKILESMLIDDQG